MPQVVVRDLVKTYRIAERDPGVLGALRGLVRRRHREVGALQGVSFSLEAGELLGFIGPNGAGKSTTIKILSGILRPTSGEVRVNGLSPFGDRRRHVAHIGVVFGQRSQLWWDLPVLDGFELLRDIYRVPPAAYRRNVDELVALLKLEPVLHQPVRQLSLGQRMRARDRRGAAARACAAVSSTSRRSGSMRRRSSRCARSCGGSTASAA